MYVRLRVCVCVYAGIIIILCMFEIRSESLKRLLSSDLRPWYLFYWSKKIFFRVTDVNGDQLDDIICKRLGLFGKTYVIQNMRNNHFQNGVTYEFSFCLNGGKKNFFVGDFNGDSKNEIMCQTFIGIRQINVSYCL